MFQKGAQLGQRPGSGICELGWVSGDEAGGKWGPDHQGLRKFIT